MLKQSSGKYSFGNEVSLADVYLVAQIESSIETYHTDITKYPTIEAVYNNLQGLPEV